MDNQQQKTAPNKTDIILMVNKSGLHYKTIGAYPEFETRRPMSGFTSVPDSTKRAVLKSIASKVVHIVVDPLLHDRPFLNGVKDVCVNAKQLTMDANLMELEQRAYRKKVDKPKSEILCRNLVAFVAGFDKIEELYFGPMLSLIEEIYAQNKWGLENRRSGAKFYDPKFSTDFINNLNSNLKTIFFNGVCIDSFDLRDVGHRCPIVIKPLEMSNISQLSKLEGRPEHTCLNKLKSLKTLSIKYFENCYHSDTVGELILDTLSGDNKVHEMFPNLKKIRVGYFCPFVMDMANTGNAGLYTGVVLDELEVEIQMPCFGPGGPKLHTHHGVLQSMLYFTFTTSSLKSSPDRCRCFDTITRIKPLKQLKVIRFRCFDAHAGRFINELHKSGCKANVIVYEKSRFERHPDHQSLWNNLTSLGNALKIFPHDKIELVMKKVKKSELAESKLREIIPADVKISFTE